MLMVLADKFSGLLNAKYDSLKKYKFRHQRLLWSLIKITEIATARNKSVRTVRVLYA
jgi:hypothetical protein